jgi:hypothetical protein
MLIYLKRAFFSLTIIALFIPAKAYELVDFMAMPQDNAILITWEVGIADDIQTFELQRSKDQQNWTSVHTVIHDGSQSAIYSFSDNQIFNKNGNETNNFYYRLKITTDSGVSYSEITHASPRYSGIFRTIGSLKAMFR